MFDSEPYEMDGDNFSTTGFSIWDIVEGLHPMDRNKLFIDGLIANYEDIPIRDLEEYIKDLNDFVKYIKEQLQDLNKVSNPKIEERIML